MSLEPLDHEDPPKFIPSYLFSLEPIAMHQPEVESLTSYVSRLANEHRLTIHDLFARVINPLVQEQKVGALGELKRSSTRSAWLGSLSHTFNSLNDVTSEWVSVLEALTHQSNLNALTMLRYRGAISSHELLKPFAAWCPECYEEKRIGNLPIYDPLIWKIDLIEFCPQHKRRFQTHCDNCSKKISHLNSLAQRGFCPYCNRWLGYNTHRTNDAISSLSFAGQDYIYSAIAEMLSTRVQRDEIKVNNFAAAVRLAIEEVMKGNTNALARELGMSYKSICSLRDGTQTPRLATLLKFCYLTNMTPLYLLTQNINEIHVEWRDKSLELPRVQKRKPRVFDAAEVRKLLQTEFDRNELPPPTMKAISLRLGFDQGFLAKHLPNECRMISERYRTYVRKEKERRTQRDCDKLTQAVFSLHQQGIYPSIKRLTKILAGGLWRSKDIRETYEKLMQDLGYRS